MREQRDRVRLMLTAFLVVSVVAAAPPMIESASAGEFPVRNSRDLRLMKSKVRAAQFLSKATFGPTEESIESLAKRINQIGYKRATGEWIDQQWDLPVSSHEAIARDLLHIDGKEADQQGGGLARYRYQAWWDIALRGEDQLRQRVAWALSQIFVIGDEGNGFNNDDRRAKVNNAVPGNPDDYTIVDWLGMSNYYDMLVDGIDGNYRQLLENVTYHPCMGTWLSSVRNRKADVKAGRFPDENYAREIMQLFSVGLHQLRQDGRVITDETGQPVPTYDINQVKELGRLFTGFRYAYGPGRNTISTGRNLGEPMQIYVPEHDNNQYYSEDEHAPAEKVVFGTVLPPLASPLNEQAVRDEIGAGLDAISNHPNVAPFICRLLIQRMVKSNPSRGYMRRVTRIFNDNGAGVRGDIRAVVKAILTDPELYRGQRVLRRSSPLRVVVMARGTEYSRLREPINRLAAWIRAMRPTSNYTGGYMMLRDDFENDWAQMPYKSPSVFNFYLPDFQPAGEIITYTPSRRTPTNALFAPEFQILNAVTSNRTLNRFRGFCKNLEVKSTLNEGTCTIEFHLEPEIELARDLGNLEEILRRFDLLLCNGTMSEATRDVIENAVEKVSMDDPSVTERERVVAILNAVVISPDCAVEQ